MPIIKSAKKRVKVAAKARARNVRTKRTMREALKAFAKALEAGRPADVQKSQAEAVSAIDIAAKKNIIHKNKAARQKAALAAKAKGVVRQSSPPKAGVKPSASPKSKVESQKPTQKQPTVKATAKRAAPAAKKPAVKKTASKKTTPKKA